MIVLILFIMILLVGTIIGTGSVLTIGHKVKKDLYAAKATKALESNKRFQIERDGEKVMVTYDEMMAYSERLEKANEMWVPPALEPAPEPLPEPLPNLSVKEKAQIEKLREWKKSLMVDRRRYEPAIVVAGSGVSRVAVAENQAMLDGIDNWIARVDKSINDLCARREDGSLFLGLTHRAKPDDQKRKEFIEKNRMFLSHKYSWEHDGETYVKEVW